jgi:hypothetical protein
MTLPSAAFLISLVLALNISNGFYLQQKPRYLSWASHFSHATPDPERVLDDPYTTFSSFEKLLFQRFADSVSQELYGDWKHSAKDYAELMTQINEMAVTRPLPRVNAQGRSMLKRLFPSWLLPAFRVMFARPFPTFSLWMNTWVTLYTTRWLMGPSKIQDLELDNGTVGKDQLLVVEKCRFLESTGCVRTCLHTCKIPTQDFFCNDMGLSVALKPNFTDYSCRFEFGSTPLPLEKDNTVASPCLVGCTQPTARIDTADKPCSA